MAAIPVLNIAKAIATDAGLISAVEVDLAASQTIPCTGKDHRLFLVVRNAAAAHAVTIVLDAPATDGGVRKSMGDLTYTVAAATDRVIDLSDTARYKTLSTNVITFTGAIASGGTIGDCKVFAIQA